MSEIDSDTIEELLERPCWVIDCLPSQVPPDSEGQFFAVERVLLEGSRGRDLRRRFASVLLALNCYYDFVVFRGGRNHGKTNPKPEKLERRVMRNREDLSIVLPSDETLITVPTDSTYMALYGPSPLLLRTVRRIASAYGLFVWQTE